MSEWTVADGETGKLRCLRCGETRTALPREMSVSAFVARIRKFQAEHERCEVPGPAQGQALLFQEAEK